MRTKAKAKIKTQTLDIFFKKKTNETASTSQNVDAKPKAKSNTPKKVSKSRMDTDHQKTVEIENARETGMTPHWLDGKPVGKKYRHFASVFRDYHMRSYADKRLG